MRTFSFLTFPVLITADSNSKHQHQDAGATNPLAGHTTTSNGLQHIRFTFVPFHRMKIESTIECHVIPLQDRDVSVLGPRMQHQVQVQCQQRARTAAEQVSCHCQSTPSPVSPSEGRELFTPYIPDVQML